MTNKQTNRSLPAYLDHAATTPVAPEVADVVLRLMCEDFGNAGSRTHLYGLQAQREIAKARELIGSVVGVEPEGVIFTSGATESNNLALLGLAEHGRSAGRRHIVTTAIEHKAVLEPIRWLEDQDFEVTRICPDTQGYVDAEEVLASVRDDTLLVSVMHANNEIGTVQPITQIADGLADIRPYFHVDAAQTFGRRTHSLKHPRIDLISLSGHKLNAPKGIGALIMRRRGSYPPLTPILFGGGQERGLRAGTLPVPLIGGLATAIEIAERFRDERQLGCERIRRDALVAFERLEPIVYGDTKRDVLPHILGIAFPGIDSEAAMVALRPIAAVSNGSACTSARYEPSHVLNAMGASREVAMATLRFSWSHDSTVDWGQIADALDNLKF
ncbi:MAG: aminotransferase class V-fold PLP-dependent enzyme [Pigmentiphaga sp.]